MKKLFYRFASSRSFTRSLSIVAVAVVAFAALELLTVQQALANVWCCNSTKCVCDASLACPTNYPTNSFKQCGVVGQVVDKGTINSEITCTGVSGANNWNSTSVARTGILYCDVTLSLNASHDGKAFCQLDLSYSRPAGLQTLCTQVPDSNPAEFTLTHQAFCDQVSGGNSNNRLTVTGTLKCNSQDVSGLNSNPPQGLPGLPVPTVVTLDDNNLPTVCGGDIACTLNLGIAGEAGKCAQLFPFLDGLAQNPPVHSLAEGQVLGLVRTFDNSSCTDPPTAVSELQTRYCSGASFNKAPVDCTFGSGKTQQDATVVGTADNALVFDVDFTPPQTLNVGCATGGNQSQDIWDFKIFGNAQLNVALINIGSLAVEGVTPTNPPITCSSFGTNNLLCLVKACPDVAAALRDARDSNLEVDITVTGRLNSTGTLDIGTPIIGQQHIDTTGN